MDRVLNPKNDRQTIYEIYRACRLCGAGAGYKMPIIQSVVDLEVGVELRQKIKECIQIEVHHTDRMPPLICELCVDKVNAYYDFMGLCHRTNHLTRKRLGLPLQTKPNSESSCILGAPAGYGGDSGSDVSHKGKKRVKKEPSEVKNEHRPSPLPSRESSVSSEDIRARHPRRSAAPEARRSAAPEARRATRQTAGGASGSESDDPSHIATSKRKRTREIETKDTPLPTKKVKIPTESTKPGPKSSKMSQHLPSPPPSRFTSNKTTTRLNTSKSTPFKETILKSSMSKDLPIKLITYEPPSKTISSKSTPSRTPSKEPTPKFTAKETKPTPKSKGSKPKETSTSLTPKISKRTNSREATSKTTTSKETTAPSREHSSKETTKEQTKPLESPKLHMCLICELPFKTSQGLSHHNIYKHLPTFTNPKLACNACSLWFPAGEAASGHHRAHRDGLPYKCNRCYGYFKLMQEFDDHFGLGECLSLYEVPDVKCWECWRMFPTARLLETHKCGGEDARPGGKCSKCSRVYSLLKNLEKHEAACSYRRKGEVSVCPEVQARLLPMQVRVARCDPLVRGGEEGGILLTDVSHTYGLDSKAHYPYLQKNVKSRTSPKPLSHMVTIDQDVKDEFSAKGDFVDDASDTDSQNVDSLSNISLKSIFPYKSEGEDKTHKFKNEFEDTDIGRKINSIIDNLTFEDQTSCSYDSDSIYGKTSDKTTFSDAKVNDNLSKDKINGKNDKQCKDRTDGKDGNLSNDRIDGKDGNLSNDRTDAKDDKLSKDKTDVKDDNSSKDMTDGKDDLTRCSDTDSFVDRNLGVSKLPIDSKDGNDGVLVKDTTTVSTDGNIDSEDKSNLTDDLTKKLDLDEVQIGTKEKVDATEVSKRDVNFDGATDVNSAADKSDLAKGEFPVVPEKEPLSLEHKVDDITKQMEIDSVIVCDQTSMDGKSVINEINDALNDVSMDTDVNDSVNVAINKEKYVISNEDISINEQSRLDDNIKEAVASENHNVDSTNQFTDTDVRIKETESENMDVEQNDQTERAPVGVNVDLDMKSQHSPSIDDFSKIDEITNKILQQTESGENKDKNNVFRNDLSNIHDDQDAVVSETHALNDINVEGDDIDSQKHICNDIVDENSTEKDDGSNDIEKLSPDDFADGKTSEKEGGTKNDKNTYKNDHSDSLSLASSKGDLNGVIQNNMNDLSDDDRNLMAEIDAQIGESDPKVNAYSDSGDLVENIEKNTENVTKTTNHFIDDLLKKPDNLRSLDLDNVSDEDFDFDG